MTRSTPEVVSFAWSSSASCAADRSTSTLSTLSLITITFANVTLPIPLAASEGDTLQAERSMGK